MANIAMDGELVDGGGKTLSARIIRSIVVAGVVVISAAILWFTYYWSQKIALEGIRERSGHTLDLVVTNLPIACLLPQNMGSNSELKITFPQDREKTLIFEAVFFPACVDLIHVFLMWGDHSGIALAVILLFWLKIEIDRRVDQHTAPLTSPIQHWVTIL